MFVAPDQLDILTEKNIQGTPAMVIEILSPSTRRRDEQIKRRLYDRAGVREYWRVDPDARLIVIDRRTVGGSLERVGELSAQSADVLDTPLIPGFSAGLQRLFRD